MRDSVIPLSLAGDKSRPIQTPAPVLSNEEVEGYAVMYRSSEARHLMSFENFLRVALIVRRHHAS